MKILFLSRRDRGYFPDDTVLVMNYSCLNFDAAVSFAPDLVIEKEYNDGRSEYRDLLTHLAKYVPQAPRLAWIWDSIYPHRKLYYRQYAHLFTHLFVANLGDVEDFRSIRANTFWLPLAFDYRAPIERERPGGNEHCIAFVGTFENPGYEERRAVLGRLALRYGDRMFAVSDRKNVFHILQRSRICFNHGFRNHLSLRPFEGLMCGCEVVTNRMWGMDRIEGLSSRVHIYNTDEELFYVVDQILAENPVFLHDTARAASWVAQGHTVKVRYQQMFAMLRTGLQETF